MKKNLLKRIAAIVLSLMILPTCSPMMIFAEDSSSTAESAVTSESAGTSAVETASNENTSTYTLTVKYYYGSVDGDLANPEVVKTYTAGDSYDVAVPKIEGFAAYIDGNDTVVTSVTGKLTSDTTVNVIYKAKKAASSSTAKLYSLNTPVVTQDVTATSLAKISFNLNGATGTEPSAISGKVGSVITLPQNTVTRKGYVFVGWSSDKDANSSGHYTSTVYTAGDSYKITKSTTLYAVWASATPANAEFYIRLDGTIATEPQGHASSEYTGAIYISNTIKNPAFHASTTGTGVASYLVSTPTNTQIAAVCKAKGISYDPDTQYVLWYVIKHEQTWHVDGVILDKAKVNLTYDANAQVGWANMPDGSQYTKDSEVTVSSTVPTRTNYVFTGWNTKADGTGTAYKSGDKFKITADTTLYAQWEASMTISYVAQTGGTVSNSTDQITDDTVTEVAKGSTATASTGYTFSGWFDENGNSVSTNATFKPTRPSDGWVPATYTAKFTANNVNLTFKNGNSTVISSSKGKYDGSFTAGANANGLSVDVDTAKNILKNQSGGKYSSMVQKIDAAKTVQDLNDLGFTFTFDGWTTEATNGGTMVSKGTNPVSLAVKYANTNTVKIFGGSEAIVYAHYSASYDQAKARVTLTAGNAEKTYDGTSLTSDVVTATGLPAGYSVTATMTADSKITNVGSTANKIASYVIKDASGTDVTSQFTNVVLNDGTLTVNKAMLTVNVTGKSGTYTYDGSKKSVSGYDVTTDAKGSVLPSGVTLSLNSGNTASASGTNAGTYAMGLSKESFTIGGSNASNYEVSLKVTDGKLTIDPQPVTINIKGHSAVLTYNGVEQSVTGFDTDASLTNASVVLKAGSEAKASGTDVNDSKTPYYPMNLNKNEFELSGSGAGNYTPTFNIAQDGKLTIIKAGGAAVTAEGYSGTYDGKSHSVTASVVGENSEHYTIYYKVGDGSWTTEAPSIRNVGEETVQVKAKGDANYEDTDVQTVTLKVTPVDLTVTASSAQKTYDGKALTDSSYTLTGGKLVEGDTLSVDIRGSITDVGSVGNTVSGVSILGADRENETSNYHVATIDGNLTVNKAAAVITVNNASKVAGSVDPVLTGTVSGLIGKNDLGTITYTRRAGETAGTYAIGAAYTENGNYDVTVIPGVFTITPVPVTPVIPPVTPNGPAGPTTPGTPTVNTVGGGTQTLTAGTAPAAGQTVTKDKAAKAALSQWALLNLLCALFTVLMVALLSLSDKKKKEYLDPDEIKNEEDEDKKKTRKKFKVGIVAEIAVAIGSVIAFILTENMHNPMAWTDNWTLLMIVLAAVSLIAYIAVGKRHDNDDQEPDAVTEG